MQNKTVIPSNQTSPLNRRAALVGIAATVIAGTTTVTARTNDPDADLRELARRAMEIGKQEVAANEDVSAADSRIAYPALPEALIVRARDIDLVMLSGIKSKPGERLRPDDIKRVRTILGLLDRQYRTAIEEGDDLSAYSKENWARAAEIDGAARVYDFDMQTARDVSDLPQAQAKRDRLHDERTAIWRALSTTPATTAQGAFAKFSAIAPMLAAEGIGAVSDAEPVTADDFVQSAASDLMLIVPKSA